MLQDVIEALHRKDPKALALARVEVAAAPESADAQHLLGIAQREAGDRAGARASFERAIDLAPDESQYHFSHASLAWFERDFDAANRSSAHAIALDPNQLGAYFLRIQLALARGDHAEAERQLSLAERVDPDHPQLLYMVGQIALLKGDGERAIGLLNQAAIAQPRDAQILATLGFAYRRQGHAAFAEQSVRKAMELDPRETGWRSLLIEALVDQGRSEDSDVELERYLQQRPEDPDVVLFKAQMQMRMGRMAEAAAEFRNVLKQRPGDARAISGLQQTLAGSVDREFVRDAWETVLRDDPRFDLAWALRLAAAIIEVDFDAVLHRWCDALPDSVAALLHRARRSESQGREAEAVAAYDGVLARLPLQFDALAGAAAIELPRDPAASIETLELSFSQATPAQAAAALAMRGLAHDRLQQLPLAIADWLKARAEFGMDPPDLPMPAAVASELVAGLPAASGNAEVVMLWGPPGSSVERLAAALRQSPGLRFLQAAERFAPRAPHYPESFLTRALNPAELSSVIDEVAPVYARLLEPHLAQSRLGVFDWLSQWDARVVPLLRHALPGTRLIAVLRDPRDMLLYWLAFGTPANLRFANPVAAAAWLGNQVEHLLFSRDALELPVLVVDMDRFDAQPAEAMQTIADFAALPASPDPRPALRPLVGVGHLPTLLPAGHWRIYRDELAEAFALLVPIAERLGYPRE